MPKWLTEIVAHLGVQLRFPQLFFLTFGVFVLDILIPEIIPYADELLLGLLTLLLGTWRKRQDSKDRNSIEHE